MAAINPACLPLAQVLVLIDVRGQIHGVVLLVVQGSGQCIVACS